jgi:hypothetical protein
VKIIRSEHAGFAVIYRKVYTISKCVSDGGKLSVGKREMVEITAIVIFFITSFFVFLPSVAEILGSLTYIIGFVTLVSLLITLVWSLARRH